MAVAKSKKQSTKKNNVTKNTEKLAWSTLQYLADNAAETIYKVDKFVSTLLSTNPDRIKTDLHTKEVYTATYKMLHEHTTNLKEIMVQHTVKDVNGNPEVDENGKYVFKKGIAKSLKDKEAILNIMRAYLMEAEGLEGIITYVTTELVVCFGSVDENVANIVNDMQSEMEDAKKRITAEQGKLLHDSINEASKDTIDAGTAYHTKVSKKIQKAVDDADNQVKKATKKGKE